MTHELSGYDEYEGQPPPTWRELTDRADNLMAQPAAADGAFATWHDGAYNAVVIDHPGEAFHLQAHDADGRKYLGVVFTAEGMVFDASEDDVPVGDDESALTRQAVRDLLDDGPGGHAYEQRHRAAVTDVLTSGWELIARQRQTEAGDLALRYLVDAADRQAFAARANDGVTVEDVSHGHAAVADGMRTVRHFDMVMGGGTAQEMGFLYVLSVERSRFVHGEPVPAEHTERTLQLDGSLVVRDMLGGGIKLTRDPHAIRTVADDLRDMGRVMQNRQDSTG